jgi:thymidylate synthase
MSSYEEQYSALLRNVLSHGAVREDRTGVGTFSMFAPPQLRIDLREGFPMLTTRKMGWKLVIKELLWFLRGQTDNFSKRVWLRYAEQLRLRIADDASQLERIAVGMATGSITLLFEQQETEKKNEP